MTGNDIVGAWKPGDRKNTHIMMTLTRLLHRVDTNKTYIVLTLTRLLHRDDTNKTYIVMTLTRLTLC